MCSPFDSLYPHLQQSQMSSRRSRSPSFLASVKGLVKKRSGLQLGSSRTEDTGSTHNLLRTSTARSHVRSWNGFSRKRQQGREQIPSMVDYLTLAQLESVWQTQEHFPSSNGILQSAQYESSIEKRQISTNHGGEQEADNLYDNIHPALRPRRRSFGDSSWSRPPSYRP